MPKKLKVEWLQRGNTATAVLPPTVKVRLIGATLAFVSPGPGESVLLAVPEAYLLSAVQEDIDA